MTDDLGASNVSFPAADGAGNSSASEVSPGSNGRLREISDADETELSTVAKRFLIAEMSRLVEENHQLKQLKDRYHDIDKRLAVLKETLRPSRTHEFLSSVCLIAGSAGLGAAPNFLSLNPYGWYVFVSASGLLLLAGIVAKVCGPSVITTARH
jgi:hypothetical protein